MLTESESQFAQFAQFAAGTALGLVGRNLAEVITDTGFHLFTGDQLSFGASLSTAIRQLEDAHVDLATAVAGTASSFLIAELGEALGLEGFGAQLFNVSASAYAGSVLNTAIDNLAHNRALLTGVDFTQGLRAVEGAVGTFFGSQLAQQILPAESLQGSIGGSLGSVAGSALGSTLLGTAWGSSLLLSNILLPGIGAFFGTLVGTFLGDLFADDPEPGASIDTFLRTGLSVDQGGPLEVITQWKSTDGFPSDATESWAKAVHTVSLEYSRAVGGFDFANAYVQGLTINSEVRETYGLAQGEAVRVLQQMRVDLDGSGNPRFYVNGSRVASAEKMVDGAIASYLKDAQIIGGDILLKRAAVNSTAKDTPTLSGDMSVAEQYTKYLNDRDAINALIASNPDSVFTAGWAITLAQANDLRLAKANVSDFHGGLGGFLASLAYAGVSVAPSDVSLKRSSGTVTLDIKLDPDVSVPGVVEVFADSASVVEQAGQRLRLTFSDSMSAVGYKNVTGTQAGSNGLTEVVGESAGRDIWIAPGTADYKFEDTGSRNISIGAAEIISSDDILIGGNGNEWLKGGVGWDWISGGAGDDTLEGGSEADVLLGGTGDDHLAGGAGLDYLEGGTGADVLDGDAGDGTGDTAGYASSNAAVNVRLDTNTTAGSASGGDADGDFLNAIVNLVGSAFNDTLVGNEKRNVLEGGAGADTLDGGSNTPAGLRDFASYFRSGKAVIASLTDTSLNTGDAAGDRYIRINSLEGSAFDDVLYGNSADNSLWGHGGDDLLVVGAGADEAFGSFGFDVMSYRLLTTGITLNLQKWSDSSSIVADDTALGVEGFEGTKYNDTMLGRKSSSEFSGGLSANDVLFGLGGADTLMGYDGSDRLDGGEGNDELDGGTGADTLDGSTGADTMTGGAGDDTYLADSASDAVVELSGGGEDKVQSSVSYTLAANIENLTLVGSAVYGTGNTLANKLIGNIGNNTLNGSTGADTMTGGAGDDTYQVDTSLDKVVEAAGTAGGFDTIFAASNYALASTQAVEFLRAAADDTGRVLVGNEINQFVYGAGGADAIQGMGGNDTLLGAAGNDGFYFNSGLNASTNVDRILDFGQASGNSDLIRLDKAVFATLGTAGFLNAGFFKANADGLATQSDDHILYSTDTGGLFYDTNGNEAGGRTQFATLANFASLTGAAALSAADIYVY